MLGKILGASAVVERSEYGKLLDVLNLMEMPYTTDTCHLRSEFSELVYLELIIPALEGYKFDLEQPLLKITVVNTDFFFNSTYPYEQTGPVGCFLFAYSSGSFKIRPFEKLAKQYNLKV